MGCCQGKAKPPGGGASKGGDGSEQEKDGAPPTAAPLPPPPRSVFPPSGGLFVKEDVWIIGAGQEKRRGVVTVAKQKASGLLVASTSGYWQCIPYLSTRKVQQLDGIPGDSPYYSHRDGDRVMFLLGPKLVKVVHGSRTEVVTLTLTASEEDNLQQVAERFSLHDSLWELDELDGAPFAYCTVRGGTTLTLRLLPKPVFTPFGETLLLPSDPLYGPTAEHTLLEPPPKTFSLRGTEKMVTVHHDDPKHKGTDKLMAIQLDGIPWSTPWNYETVCDGATYSLSHKKKRVAIVGDDREPCTAKREEVILLDEGDDIAVAVATAFSLEDGSFSLKGGIPPSLSDVGDRQELELLPKSITTSFEGVVHRVVIEPGSTYRCLHSMVGERFAIARHPFELCRKGGGVLDESKPPWSAVVAHGSYFVRLLPREITVHCCGMTRYYTLPPRGVGSVQEVQAMFGVGGSLSMTTPFTWEDTPQEVHLVPPDKTVTISRRPVTIRFDQDPEELSREVALGRDVLNSAGLLESAAHALCYHRVQDGATLALAPPPPPPPVPHTAPRRKKRLSMGDATGRRGVVCVEATVSPREAAAVHGWKLGDADLSFDDLDECKLYHATRES